jgi:multiple sugar transport system substrate-binding protein
MAWATNKETTKKTVAISANVPTRKSALLDPELQKIRWHFPALYESYETAIIYPPVPEWSEMDDAISINFAKVLTKEFTVKQALDKAEEDVTKVLKDAGYL